MNNILILLLFITIQLEAKVTLPIFSTKQASNSLRFLDKDGRFTYYIRNSNELVLATNFQAKSLIKSEGVSNFTVTATQAQKRLAIESHPSFLINPSETPDHDIYIEQLGKGTLKKVASGANATLHLQDSYLSYFSSKEEKLFFKNLENDDEPFSFQVSEKTPYGSLSQPVMISEDLIVYLDTNNDGINGLLKWSKKDKKVTLLEKADSSTTRFELCYHNFQLFLMSIDLGVRKKTEITLLHPDSDESFKSEKLYSSNKLSRGHLNCTMDSGMLYFIEDVSDTPTRTTYEVVELSIKSKKREVITREGNITNLYELDKRLLTQIGDECYLVKGDNNSKARDIIK